MNSINSNAKSWLLCHSIMFNKNILISGRNSRNFLLYSIDIDSFSIIPHEFTETRKILINAKRMYLLLWKKYYEFTWV
ncbi:unnamed protein product [Blepharisma stoltei]|uniref:Uncharacterized protein n=1 Tax=Blepharisma stoltei TaxID=1481888 RepID=A0AAU9K3A7_9CILI|nr:unnamed protein product [Blepharisma stoltei]